jgi:hypothetical protein
LAERTPEKREVTGSTPVATTIAGEAGGQHCPRLGDHTVAAT